MDTLVRILKLEAKVAAKERYHDPWEFEENISQPCADTDEREVQLDEQEWMASREGGHLALGPPQAVVRAGSSQRSVTY